MLHAHKRVTQNIVQKDPETVSHILLHSRLITIGNGELKVWRWQHIRSTSEPTGDHRDMRAATQIADMTYSQFEITLQEMRFIPHAQPNTILPALIPFLLHLGHHVIIFCPDRERTISFNLFSLLYRGLRFRIWQGKCGNDQKLKKFRALGSCTGTPNVFSVTFAVLSPWHRVPSNRTCAPSIKHQTTVGPQYGICDRSGAYNFEDFPRYLENVYSPDINGSN